MIEVPLKAVLATARSFCIGWPRSFCLDLSIPQLIVFYVFGACITAYLVTPIQLQCPVSLHVPTLHKEIIVPFWDYVKKQKKT